MSRPDAGPSCSDSRVVRVYRGRLLHRRHLSNWNPTPQPDRSLKSSPHRSAAQAAPVKTQHGADGTAALPNKALREAGHAIRYDGAGEKRRLRGRPKTVPSSPMTHSASPSTDSTASQRPKVVFSLHPDCWGVPDRETAEVERSRKPSSSAPATLSPLNIAPTPAIGAPTFGVCAPGPVAATDALHLLSRPKWSPINVTRPVARGSRPSTAVASSQRLMNRERATATVL